MASDEIPEEMQLDSMAQAKGLSHPLRVAILRRLIEGAHTNEELADMLGVASGKLYFHTRKLLDLGMIALVGTRQKGPLTEKLYRATARRFTLPVAVKGGDTPPLEGLIGSGLELYRSTWHATEGLDGQPELGFHLVLPQSLQRQREFVSRLLELMNDFQTASAATEDAVPLALTMLLHAVPPPEQDLDTQEKETE